MEILTFPSNKAMIPMLGLQCKKFIICAFCSSPGVACTTYIKGLVLITVTHVQFQNRCLILSSTDASQFLFSITIIQKPL